MITIISMVLTIIGAINWFLVGVAQFDLVAYLFGGSFTIGARIIYSLVGLAGIWLLGVLIAKRGHLESDCSDCSEEHHQH